MLGQHQFPAQEGNEQVWRSSRRHRVVKGLKGYRLRVAENQRDPAENNGDQSHGDDLLAQGVDVFSVSENHDVHK